jgi:uncharacterized membrane protein
MNSLSSQPSTATTRTAITIVVFVALSCVGALVKIPSPVGSIALDSSPGYFAAAYFNPLVGGLIGFLGHLASAATAGFPLGLWHLFVACHMFCWCVVFGAIVRYAKRTNSQAVSIAIVSIGAIVTIFLNGIVSPYLLVAIPGSPVPKAALMGLIPFLLAASTVDVVIASAAFYIISRSKIRGL